MTDRVSEWLQFYAKLITVSVLGICLIVLALHVIPGTLDRLVFLVKLASVLLVPFFGAIIASALILGGVMLWKGDALGFRIPWGYLTAILIILINTIGMLYFHVPLRLGFCLFWSEFQAYVTEDPVDEIRSVELNRWVGIYWVERYAADPDGGVYFYVNRSKNSLLNLEYHGFCYQPEGYDPPSSLVGYQQYHLIGNWYWFETIPFG